jgi:Fe-S oxidoreductase
MQAKKNIEILKNYNVKKIAVSCPHCFNTLKNEYKQMGADLPVEHYTEFLSRMELPAINGNGKDLYGRMTYHDSCYLGRYNQIYAAPRALLAKADVEQVEMSRQGVNSFCCGGGGGQMWMETDANTRINHRRLKDALDVKADVIATACPYCLLMFDDAIRSKGLSDQVKVMDIVEVLVSQMKA